MLCVDEGKCSKKEFEDQSLALAVSVNLTELPPNGAVPDTEISPPLNKPTNVFKVVVFFLTRAILLYLDWKLQFCLTSARKALKFAVKKKKKSFRPGAFSPAPRRS